ncbi:MAG: 23S rRNA (pseudouridine(1915)-N(3))-methyltransferase RlmH [Thermosipho sp. (in: Bacteria)]|nr:23S rRNA (pseudouridine(1915)-N(3))-methyltransferase RlmH [Thermosipho sp. (in: thermotogales)]
MKIKVYIPGKISKHLVDAYNFYINKIRRFSEIEVVFVKLGGDINKMPKEVVLRNEAQEILKKLNGKDYYLIDLQGKQMNSLDFSQLIENLMLIGEVNFVIGGPLGLDKSLIEKAKKRISLSKLTFTHELALILLLEQIFRGFKIINNEKYHY